MQEFEIHNARPGEEVTIRQLAEATWWSAYEHIINRDQIRFMLDTIYDLGVLKDQIRSGEQQYIILRTDRQPSGFAAYSPRPEDPAVFKLHKLYVLPSDHGKGLGRKLVDEVASRAHATGAHALDLNVNRQNPALSFYKKYGFRVIREEDIPIGPYWMNDYVMRLDLGSNPIA